MKKTAISFYPKAKVNEMKDFMTQLLAFLVIGALVCSACVMIFVLGWYAGELFKHPSVTPEPKPHPHITYFGRIVPILEDKPVTEQVEAPTTLPAYEYVSKAPWRVALGGNGLKKTYRVSAYCPEECCCEEWADGFTASGVPAVGKIIAAPSNIPFGTKMNIPGYGLAVVQDRGGAIKGNRLDILFPTHFLAKKWGVKMLEITEPTPLESVEPEFD